jgi:hypothetical protein
MRPILHASAETCLYADLSGRAAFVEEFGNLGPMIAGEKETADYTRACLASLWAHGGKAALWWCAFDMNHIEEAPYDWLPLERQLGLFRQDYTAKMAALEIADFARLVREVFPVDLPKRAINAVCLLTPGQDQWAVGFSAFILAKQAGFDLKFHYADRPLPDASLYIVPSLRGTSALSRAREGELWEKARAGATVYLSWENGHVGEFNATGLEVLTSSERNSACRFQFADSSYSLPSSVQLKVRPTGARVLAREDMEIRFLPCPNLAWARSFSSRSRSKNFSPPSDNFSFRNPKRSSLKSIEQSPRKL